MPADQLSPFVELDRPAWAALREHTRLPLRADELERIRGLGERIDLQEVTDVYLPLSRLLNLHVRAARALHRITGTFLGTDTPPVPFVIGLAGSVAVGKSTTARLLQRLLARWPDHPRVDLATTDGFLLPNAELDRRGLMDRKGFPESYDRRALLRFVGAVKSGVAEVEAPVYSHLSYDIVPGEHTSVRRPDVLIVEGLNVLQPPRPRADGTFGLAVSDFFDFSLYVDAEPDDVPAPAPDGVRRPALTLSPFCPPGRRGGHGAGGPDLGHDQRAQPRAQHRPDPGPGHRRARQGLRPRRTAGPAPQDLSPGNTPAV
jgi:type I pantothenate kinase